MLFLINHFPKGAKMKKALAAMLLAVLSMSPVSAVEQYVEAIPTTWQIRMFSGEFPVIYFAGPSCGPLFFNNSATSVDKRVFVAMMTGAKLAGKTVFIYYDDANCNILSWGLKQE